MRAAEKVRGFLASTTTKRAMQRTLIAYVLHVFLHLAGAVWFFRFARANGLAIPEPVALVGGLFVFVLPLVIYVGVWLLGIGVVAIAPVRSRE